MHIWSAIGIDHFGSLEKERCMCAFCFLRTEAKRCDFKIERHKSMLNNFKKARKKIILTFVNCCNQKNLETVLVRNLVTWHARTISVPIMLLKILDLMEDMQYDMHNSRYRFRFP